MNSSLSTYPALWFDHRLSFYSSHNILMSVRREDIVSSWKKMTVLDRHSNDNGSISVRSAFSWAYQLMDETLFTILHKKNKQWLHHTYGIDRNSSTGCDYVTNLRVSVLQLSSFLQPFPSVQLIVPLSNNPFCSLRFVKLNRHVFWFWICCFSWFILLIH